MFTPIHEGEIKTCFLIKCFEKIPSQFYKLTLNSHGFYWKNQMIGNNIACRINEKKIIVWNKIRCDDFENNRTEKYIYIFIFSLAILFFKLYTIITRILHDSFTFCLSGNENLFLLWENFDKLFFSLNVNILKYVKDLRKLKQNLSDWKHWVNIQKSSLLILVELFRTQRLWFFPDFYIQFKNILRKYV